MKKYLFIAILIGLIMNLSHAQQEAKNEAMGIDVTEKASKEIIPPASTLKNLDGIPSGGLLLIPESGNDLVMAFDPVTGDLIDPAFIVDDATDFFSTPIHIVQNVDKDRLYISDQLKDYVLEFDNDGNYIGVFAPAGGVNLAQADNIRGMTLKEGTDHLLVSDGNNDAIQEFDGSGNYIGTFGPANRVDPFDIIYQPSKNQYLINDIDGGNDADSVQQQGPSGTPITNLINGIDFPEQIALASNGNILVATFSSPSGIYEFTPTGTLVGYYDVITGCRGIYELGNGNWLVTAGTGVYEIDNTNTVISTKYEATGHSFRFISFVEPPETTVNVTFRVDMQEQTVAPEGVHIAGSFPAPYPSWDPAGLALNPPPLGPVYTLTLQLEPGTYIEYKYINGDAWGEDETVPGACAQNGNRFITVPDNDTILPIKCYAKCLACVLPPVDVTFQVDMSNETVSPDGVHVAGSFNNWGTSATQLTDQGGGIYAVTLTLGEGEYHEFKYLNGNAWGTDESVPPGCAVNNNRYLTVPSSATTLPLHCFGSCDPCTSVTDINVTFRVDMSEQTVAAEGVHIAGSFQGWNPAGTLMNDMGGGIWEYSTVLQSGDYHEYKFVNGDAWGEDESVPGACAQNSNRYITVPAMDTTLPAFCYASCVVCSPPLYDVTFNVDMSNQIVSGDGVHLAGSFQGWDPSATAMTDMGNGIYSITLSLEEGVLHEYKFVNGNDWPFAENVPGECAGLGGNREFYGPSVNTVLDTVCFGECGPCMNTLYTFDLKVILEGAFNGTDMNTDLFDNGVLANNQPYNTAPWNYNGGEFISAPGGTDIVDWVYIQLRETDGDATTATIDKLLDHQAAVVLSDGTVARPDGTPNILYTGNITQNLYIVVYHRNHLAVMSASPLVESGGTFTYDFTDALSKAYLSGQKDLGGGMFGMIAGDSNGDGTVNSDDLDFNWSNNAGNAGYHISDLNLDMQVNNPDKDDCWVPNNNATTTVP
ncbi:MAG: hypothetical protein KDC05_07760 [Bacteroidales bacterium]|nr:hypothetical protein [Bacteroidales bacterium]